LWERPGQGADSGVESKIGKQCFDVR